MSDLARALAALDALPEPLPVLGCWRAPDGTLGPELTRQEWREGLLSGETDPRSFLRSLALRGFVLSDAFDDLLAKRRRSQFRVIDGGTPDGGAP